MSAITHWILRCKLLALTTSHVEITAKSTLIALEITVKSEVGRGRIVKSTAGHGRNGGEIHGRPRRKLSEIHRLWRGNRDRNGGDVHSGPECAVWGRRRRRVSCGFERSVVEVKFVVR